MKRMIRMEWLDRIRRVVVPPRAFASSAQACETHSNLGSRLRPARMPLGCRSRQTCSHSEPTSRLEPGSDFGLTRSPPGSLAVGPDEYHGNVNNSVYTAVAARQTLRFAATACKVLDLAGVACVPPPLWRQVADGLRVEFDASLQYHPEFTGYQRGDRHEGFVKQGGLPCCCTRCRRVCCLPLDAAHGWYLLTITCLLSPAHYCLLAMLTSACFVCLLFIVRSLFAGCLLLVLASC